MTDYEQLFFELLDELDDTAMIDVADSYMGHETSLRNIDLILSGSDHDITVADSVKAFYVAVNGVRAEWHVKEDSDIDSEGWGTFLIHDFATMIGGTTAAPKWKDALWMDSTDESKKAALQSLRIFDFFNKDKSECVCLRIQDGEMKDELWLYGLETELQPLGLNIETYIKLLRNTRGFYGWHWAALDHDGYRADELKDELPQIFASPDLSDFD